MIHKRVKCLPKIESKRTGERKALKQIAEREKIKLEECVFVGDHDNDLKIAEEAGLSIAFNAHSEELKKVANVVVAKKDLREILKYVL